MPELKVLSQPDNRTISVARQPLQQPKITVAPPQQQQQLKVASAPPPQELKVSSAPIGQGQITQINDQPYTPKMNLAEFGQKIKQKYPEYADISDEELGRATLEKYPEYADRVDTPVVPEAPVEADRSKGFFGRLGDDIKQRYENVKDSSKLVDEGKQGNLGFGFQLAGQLAGAVGDVVGEGITSAYRTVTPDKIQEGVALAGDELGKSEIVQKGFGAYEKFKEKNPALAKNLEAAGNIASVIPVGKGAGLAATALERVAPKTALRIASLAEKTAARFAPKIVDDALENAIEVTRPILKVGEKEAALAGGQGYIEKGIVKIKENASDIRIAESVKDIVTKNANPVDNLNSVKEGIRAISESVGEELTKNNGIFNTNQLKTVLNKAKEGSKVVFGSDKALESAYDAVVTEMIRIVDETPKNLRGLWDARKMFDDVMESKFGKKAFEDATDNARTNAIRDVRRAVNDYIGNRLPEGNQYKATLKRLSNMYDARDRLASIGARMVDQTKVQRFMAAISKNPTIATLAAVGLGGSLMAIISSPIALGALAIGAPFYIGKKLIKPSMVKSVLLKIINKKNMVFQAGERQVILDFINNINIDPAAESEPAVEETEQLNETIE